jgi:homoserine kinase
MTPGKRAPAGSPRRSVRVYAPGCIGNVGPGLDILGLAVAGAGDLVEAALTEQPGVRVLDSGHAELPADPDRHASAIAAGEVLRLAGARGGIDLRLEKGLPLAGGQGGSAASAVAGAVAANELLGAPLDQSGILAAALAAESAVAGRHLDNIAPSLLGGAVLIRATDPPDLVRLPVPPELWIALALPDQQLRTAVGRAALPATVPLATALHQAAQVAAIVAGLTLNDYELLGRAIDDRIAEPARAPLLPGFAAARMAALEAGALGSSISGSGPTAFALCRGEASAQRVADVMAAAYRAGGIACQTRIAQPDLTGTRLVS